MSFAGRFTDRAGDYVSGRPSYPPAAIDALLDGLGDPADVVVADLGAGTGISSRLLAERGAQVLAIEPNQAMREAAEPHPRVEWIAASAEHTGLGEASADLVTAFQAFHWFDQRAALDETVRILRPGGRAAVIYNERDERDPFTAARPPGRRMRTISSSAARASNQWNAWNAVTRSTLASPSPVCSAFAAIHSTRGCGSAASRIAWFGSIASTCAPRSASRREEIPVPAPRSATTTSAGSPSPSSSASIAAGGYDG
ncbi:MAG TPA: class I SAM-dependent methyltransferase, partial [Candidatus Elarobacter sp.]|nr:class I SAM-dependent methyltransferase [Candidatus Elarobacter sp.]